MSAPQLPFSPGDLVAWRYLDETCVISTRRHLLPIRNPCMIIHTSLVLDNIEFGLLDSAGHYIHTSYARARINDEFALLGGVSRVIIHAGDS